MKTARLVSLLIAASGVVACATEPEMPAPAPAGVALAPAAEHGIVAEDHAGCLVRCGDNYDDCRRVLGDDLCDPFFSECIRFCNERFPLPKPPPPMFPPPPGTKQ